MPFSEKVKLEAKKKAAFRCCICHKPFVEIHHIIPQSEGGPDTLNNAATLCSSCHDLYGGNPEKRKIIKQMRDHWWDLMSKRESALTHSKETDVGWLIEENHNHEGSLKSKAIAIYHLVFSHEDFETAANHLFELVKNAQKQCPNQNRVLFLDIEGHRNKKGGFEHDMFELQTDYLMGSLSPFLKEAYMPLNHFINPRLQDNDLPDEIKFVKE
jgi:HNH endonuclease